MSPFTIRNGYLLLPDNRYLMAHYRGLKLIWWKDEQGNPEPYDPIKYQAPDEQMVFEVNLKTLDAWDWRQLRRLLQWVAYGVPGGQTWARVAYKIWRRMRNDMQQKVWEEVLPPEIVEWATKCIDKNVEETGADCVDNYRVARVGNTAQKRRYDSQVSGGCCGFADWVAEGPDGKKYWLGYNYGH